MAEVATATYDIEPVHGDLPGTQLYKACMRKLLSPEGVYSGDAHTYRFPAECNAGPGDISDPLAYNIRGFDLRPMGGVNPEEQRRLLTLGSTIITAKFEEPLTRDSSGHYLLYRPGDLDTGYSMGAMFASFAPEDWDPESPLVVQKNGPDAGYGYTPVPDTHQDPLLYELQALLDK
jgi:hypothetical protein